MRYSFFPLPVMGGVVCVFLFVSGCVNQPLLLRNRSNVPPPVLAPAPTVDDNIDLSVDVIADITPVAAKPAAATLPPPEINTTQITYTVKKRDSFWGIARKFGVNKSELAACNNLALDKPLNVGVVLLIPPGGGLDVPGELAKQPKIKPVSVKAPVKPKENYAPTSNDGTYVVRPADTLWKIARRNDITTKSLADANGLDLRKPIQPGMKLVIPGSSAKPRENVVPETVVDSEPENTPVADDLLGDPVPDIGDDTDILDDAVTAADSKKSDNSAKKTVDDVLDELDSKSVNDTSVETPGSPYTEEVIPNETLQEIADRHGCTVEEILKVNPSIKSEDDLKPFTSIIIPKK